MSDRPINLYDFEGAAKERLERMAYDYYVSGAMDEITLRRNRRAFDRIRLRYRVLRDVSRRDLATSLLGRRLALPVLVAPTAFQRMAHPDGEAATARAAAAAGTVMMLSTLSNTAMEEVTGAARAAAEGLDGAGNGAPVWFQLYVYRDRGVTQALVRRAEAAGCEAIVLTVDAPLWGRRERDVRNRFRLPEGLAIENLLPAGHEAFPEAGADSGLAAYVREAFDPALTWGDLEWLCGITELPVLVKGLVHPEDAALAAERGAAGVVVSNHGGRQLDTAPATIEALPEVAARVVGRRETDDFAVILDGGVRRGTDVVKALALGADAVAVGRPVLWGLSVDGEAGVRRVIEMLREEMDLAMGLCGTPSVSAVRRAGTDLARLPGSEERS